MNRPEMQGRMKDAAYEFDFIIIGGGATGIGILLEAISRGYSVLLLESEDFTKSTSGKSTKLVHGGVRYLANGDIGLVREACKERAYLLKNAPHIVKNVSFIIPTYTLFDTALYTAGLKFYDLLAGKLSLGRSVIVSKTKLKESVPVIKTHKLKGGIKYHDGQFDDSRLAMAVLRTACNEGAVALNYMEVTDLIKDEDEKISGVRAEDKLNGESYLIKGKNIINATGVFSDRILSMDSGENEQNIRPSQGIHIVVEKEFFPGEKAMMIPKTSDGRVLFAVPWLGKVILGTTDTPIKEICHEPKALKEEIDFILNTTAGYLVKAPTYRDIKSVFAGLRPLAAGKSSEKTREISRSHKITVSGSGLISIIGGKWTTFRKMAQDTVDKAEVESGIKKTSSPTKTLSLFSSHNRDSGKMAYPLYGSESDTIEKLPGAEKIISKDLNITESLIIYSIRYEMAMKLEDVLCRRTRALLLDVRESLKIAPEVATIMAKEMGKGQHWIEEELKSFQKIASLYLPPEIIA